MSRMLLGLIGAYRKTASVRRARCRFHPTCSAYAAEAIEIHGAGRGVWLSVKRLAKCQPFGPFGFDPVPAPGASGQTHKLGECDV